MLEAYREFIGDGRYRYYYRLTAPLILLAVFSSCKNQERFLELTATTMGEHAYLVLTQVLDGFHDGFRPPQFSDRLFEGNWQRAHQTGLRLSEG